MKALVRRDGALHLDDLPWPAAGPGETLVRVAVAGVCRTDLQAAAGRLPVREPRVLGHEFSGTVDGARVAVDPVLPCGGCARCLKGRLCSRPQLLGIHRDGAFAEAVVVPTSAVHPLPEGLSFEAGAYAEPVAAALAVPRAGLSGQILVHGEGRVARLVERVLAAEGLRAAAGLGPYPDDAFDVTVETDPAGLNEVLRVTRAGGRVILKSRPAEEVAFDFALAVRKEITLTGAAYAPFPEALALLASGRLDLSDLIGPTLPLEDFTRLRSDESLKTFLTPLEVPAVL